MVYVTSQSHTIPYLKGENGIYTYYACIYVFRYNINFYSTLSFSLYQCGCELSSQLVIIIIIILLYALGTIDVVYLWRSTGRRHFV